jgi:hypothetical protein
VTRLREAVQQQYGASFSCRQIVKLDAGDICETLLYLRLCVHGARKHAQYGARDGKPEHSTLPSDEALPLTAAFSVDETILTVHCAE